MAPPELYVGQAKLDPSPVGDPARAWSTAQLLGVFLLLAGVIDLALAMLSPAPGDPLWRFATTALLIGGLPLPTIGLMAGVMASIATGKPVRAKVWGGISILFAIGVAVGLVALLMALPEVRTQTPAEAMADLNRTTTRTIAVGFVFIALLGYSGFKGVLYKLDK